MNNRFSRWVLLGLLSLPLGSQSQVPIPGPVPVSRPVQDLTVPDPALQVSENAPVPFGIASPLASVFIPTIRPAHASFPGRTAGDTRAVRPSVGPAFGLAPGLALNQGIHNSGRDEMESVTYPRLRQDRGPTLWRRAVLFSTALAASSAAIAHWSSGEGDKAYDRYLTSAGQTRREKAFDEAERYDRIAGAAFLVMEAGLVMTAYFVFF